MKVNREVIRFVVFRTLGNFLVLASLYAIGRTLGPAAWLEAKYRVNQFRNVRYEIAWQGVPARPDKEITDTVKPTPFVSNTTFFGKLAGGDKIEFLEPVSSRFGIIIPKIGANAPIAPNVDAGNPEAYLEALKTGVAHAAGTVFPGVPGNIFLFAHSTDDFWNVGRYNAIFYLLKELERGDEVDVFLNGKRHIYRVTDKIIVNPDEVEYLTRQTNFEQLTLQTCWPPGTTFKRLLVLAVPEKDYRD
ncbi:MAG: sortase family protein, sortase A [Candidatus Gottesmanbacteria bacterium GW2011_GWA2_43_14]|uniref:Sortase family protein, sortase A n=1 Tax=Candidatus Gottesmanbacteria bacterium GW2011_GWA2_43_14 TaxID=1618443 RepID=A0A0G1DJC2_9BACT|nr:MAG: sortase family protein, sortase A [Candidatus Gottesmanbacteria bacterium GW2011_GWA2_43_14]